MEHSNNDKELNILQTKFKLKQVNEIFYELTKIKEGLESYTCSVRNLLQVFSGEMELYCSININREVEILSFLLNEGINTTNWIKINKIVLEFYEKILSYYTSISLAQN